MGTTGWITSIEAQMKPMHKKIFKNIVQYSPKTYLSKELLYRMGYSDDQIEKVQDQTNPIDFWKIIPANYYKGCMDEEADDYDPYALFDCSTNFKGSNTSCCTYSTYADTTTGKRLGPDGFADTD